MIAAYFKPAFTQVLQMLIFLSAGYALSAKSLLPAESGKALSCLMLYLFVPAMNFQALSGNMRPEFLGEHLVFLGVGLAVLLVTCVLAWLIGSKVYTEEPQLRVCRHALSFPNNGYMGNPIALALFGEAALTRMIVFTIPYGIAVFSWGLYLFGGRGVKDGLKKILNPAMIAILLGCLWGLLDIPRVAAFNQVIRAAADCMSPCAMILTGIVLGRSRISQSQLTGRFAVLCALRLAILPLCAGLILYWLRAGSALILTAVLTLAMPAGLNVVLFNEMYGGRDNFGALVCSTTTLLSLITIPLIVSILQTVL